MRGVVRSGAGRGRAGRREDAAELGRDVRQRGEGEDDALERVEPEPGGEQLEAVVERADGLTEREAEILERRGGLAERRLGEEVDDLRENRPGGVREARPARRRGVEPIHGLRSLDLRSRELPMAGGRTNGRGRRSPGREDARGFVLRGGRRPRQVGLMLRLVVFVPATAPSLGMAAMTASVVRVLVLRMSVAPGAAVGVGPSCDAPAPPDRHPRVCRSRPVGPTVSIGADERSGDPRSVSRRGARPDRLCGRRERRHEGHEGQGRQALPHREAQRQGGARLPAESKKKKKAAKVRAASLVPPDYTALTGLSQPTFADVQRTVHELKVGDGTRLHLEIVKPAGAKDLGVIVEASPYHGTLYDRTGARMIPLPGKDGTPVGLSGFFPKRGYAVVFMDLRGTGLSSGCLNSLGRADQSDLRDVVEWAAAQPLVQRPRRDDRPLLRRLDADHRDAAQAQGPRHDRAERRPAVDVRPPVAARRALQRPVPRTDRGLPAARAPA